jgi:excisionase family DNA binding protein
MPEPTERPAAPRYPLSDYTLDLSEAAALLGVSADTLRRYADDGKIEFRRTPGGRRRFRPAEIESHR